MTTAEDKLYNFADNVRQEGDEAKEFVSEGISKVKTKMSGKTYGPPTVPKTPSKSINKMLESRCGKTFDNPVKAAVAFYICFVFTAINRLYSLIHSDKSKESQTMWMAACGAVAVAIILKTLIVYCVVIGCSFLAHNLLFYGAILLCLFGVGLAVSGIVFFDKEAPAAFTGSKISSTTFAKRVTTTFDSSSKIE